MVQIIGANLDLAMQELNVKSEKMFQAEPDFLDVSLQVWELNNEDFAFLCNIEPEDWKEEYGWWVNGGCNHSKEDIAKTKINNKELIVFIQEFNEPYIPWGYTNLADYLESHLGITSYNNVAYYIHSLAELNNMTKAKLMKKYW